MSEQTASVLPPPIAPFPAFKTLLRVFQQHGAPDVVDHGALRKRFAPGSVENLLAALRFLGLIGPGGAPTAQLAPLTAAVDTPAWPTALRDALTRAYGPVLEGLGSATPAQLNQRLRSAYSLHAETCRRSATFLLAAASEAEAPLSPYLVSPAHAKGRLLPVRTEPGAEDAEAGEALTARLIDKFPAFDPAWPDALKAHWFQQFNELIQLVKPDEQTGRSQCNEAVTNDAQKAPV